MNMCPLCNGFNQVEYTCAKCGHKTEDMGRVMDYFDDYSAYMEIEQMKLIDGITTTASDHQCAHLFYCILCHHEEVMTIQE
ncbi:hypothetical protein [Metabacillus iocasae]|uniref:Uncharacterized protein n=1 Tax=Priestia iocasae TaxID=2291674 RepID=A0ABS2QU37_9BACI|nr:hypothetical protein [Metabacillus iocasae]MBM7702708.1 hypothetical protein [Metabacillus iocasae]